jgi:outer membrane receptor protein involved in Fe transport
MRIAAGLLACLGAGVLSSALADPPTDTTPPATTAAAPPSAVSAPAAADTAAAQAAAAKAAAEAEKAELDRDTRHFLAEGYKPEMHGGEQIYCRKETALGSRLTPVKNCGTIEQLKLSEQRTQTDVSETQRRQTGTSNH